MNNKLRHSLLPLFFLAVAVVASAASPRLTVSESVDQRPDRVTTGDIDYASFLARHDMLWDTITADPPGVSMDNGIRTGYYAGAIMGNGLLGTNLYKLRENVYRLNAGRSDVTEARHPYDLFNSARLPIGYFTLSTVGSVKTERMRLSLYDATTTGRFTTDRGSIDFATYVHAEQDYIVFETKATGDEADYAWDFVAQQAVSPRAIFRKEAPAGYLNVQGQSNPEAVRRTDGDIRLCVQPLATDSTFAMIARVYVVAWREVREGAKRRIIATIAQQATEQAAVAEAKATLRRAFATKPETLAKRHRTWWHRFYADAAFVSFPDVRTEAFYWAQYYKFASTARPGRPIADLQGVWPTWDTPWTAIWMNLNLQLTYSWQAKANLGSLAQPLWDAMWEHRANLVRNVTDVPGQEAWTDAAVLPRTATYDFLAKLDPATVEKNQYEVGNLTWTLFYYWQLCRAYGDDEQMTKRLFPLLKQAVAIFYHLRTEQDGRYGLPATASPEYADTNIGTNANYDLANLRWGLQTLIDLNRTYALNDPKAHSWQDFLDRLVDYPYSPSTGFKVSDKFEFTNTSHRHYSHLFMIYPYHLLDWENPADSTRMALSVDRWKGNQGYSRTGKAAMLLSRGDGDGAWAQMKAFLDRYVKPNTLYAETGPVIETPMAAVSTLHEFYLQDWGDKIRVFFGMPTEWRNASFIGLRAAGAFLVSATRHDGHTVFVQVESERGGSCRIQTEIPVTDLVVRNAKGQKVGFSILSARTGTISVDTKPGEIFFLTDKMRTPISPAPQVYPTTKIHYYGDGSQTAREVR